MSDLALYSCGVIFEPTAWDAVARQLLLETGCCTILTGGAFRHGPLELAGLEHTAVFFIPRGRTAELLTRVALEAAGHGSRIVVITDVAAEYPEAVTVLRLPEVPEELFALAASGTQALLLFQVAAQRGVTAGVFRYGSKITGRE